MYISNLQILCLFTQLTDPAHIRFQLPFVITQDTNGQDRALPFVLIAHLGNRGIEAGAQAILQAAHGTALVFQGAGPRNQQFDGQQGDKKVWVRHGVKQHSSVEEYT
jgi:hypothetical protein